MNKVKGLGCVSLLIGVSAVTGYSQGSASDYVAPSEAVPRGKAPKMQVQLLNSGEQTKQYAVIFYQGDEAFFRTAGICGEVSRHQCPFHGHWSLEWSNGGVV